MRATLGFLLRHSGSGIDYPPASCSFLEHHLMKLHRPGIALLAIIGVSLLLRSATYICWLDTALPWFPEMIPSTDMHATWEWSNGILAGDLLGHDTYHPEVQWMKDVGTKADWAQWWGDVRIFQQEPLYAYFIAALRWLLPSPLHTIPLLQLLLGGTLLPLAVYVLGRQIGGARTGLYAAAIAAVFGPGIFYQTTLLRDWTIPIGSALALALMIAGIRQTRLSLLLGAGLLLGVGATMKSSALLWLPICLCWLWFATKRPTSYTYQFKGAAALLFAFALGISPVIVRNCLVGAPPFALSNRLPEGLVLSNAADARPIGDHIPPSLVPTLKAAGGNPAKVIMEILRGYRNSPRAALRVQGTKLLAAFAPDDFADNQSYQFGTLRLPALRICPSWGFLLPLALPGMYFLLTKRKDRGLWVAGILATNTIAILVPNALGRYRLEALPLLALGAAQTINLAVVHYRTRSWKRLALCGTTVVSIALLTQWAWPPSWLQWDPRQSIQLSDRAKSMKVFCHQRRYMEAADEAADLSATASLFPAAQSEIPKARNDEIAFLVSAMMDATESNNLRRVNEAVRRARQRVHGATPGECLTRQEVTDILTGITPPGIAPQFADLLLAPPAAEPASYSRESPASASSR